jgi:hypothetical protein
MDTLFGIGHPYLPLGNKEFLSVAVVADKGKPRYDNKVSTNQLYLDRAARYGYLLVSLAPGNFVILKDAGVNVHYNSPSPETGQQILHWRIS